MSKIALIATAEEVAQLRAIRDLRLAGQPYKAKKTAWFKQFRAKYGITYDGLLKVETEKEDRLGKVQYCSNNCPIKVAAELTQARDAGNDCA